LVGLAWLAGNSAYTQLHSTDQGIAIAVTTLRSGADERAESIEDISEGVKVNILDTIGDWYKVSLMNKEQGWIHAAQVEII